MRWSLVHEVRKEEFVQGVATADAEAALGSRARKVRWLIGEAEHKLEAILLGVRIPVRPIPIPRIIRFIFNLPGGNSECDSLIWLGGDLCHAGQPLHRTNRRCLQ